MKRKGKISTEGYRSDSPDRFNDFNIIPSSYIDMTGVNHDVLMIPMGGHTVGNPVLAKPGERYFFPRHDFVFEQAMPEDAMMRYQRIAKYGGNLPKAQMYNSQVGVPILDNQFIYPSKFDPYDESPMQQRAKACHKGECLEGANTYYNTYVASRLGLPNTWKMNEAYGIVSGDPNQPYGKSMDSWDAAAETQAKGDIQVYAAPLYNDPEYKRGRRSEKDAEKYWNSFTNEEKKNIYSQMALGTLVNYGDWGGVDLSRLQGSNEKAGLYPSRHSARVVGFTEDGMPVVYDYGKIKRLDQSGLGHPITNITTPKGNVKYNYEYVKDWQAKNQKELKYNPNEKLFLTKPSTRPDEDPFTKEEIDFVEGINKNIPNLMQLTGMSQEDIIKAGKVAFGIMEGETRGGRGSAKAKLKEFGKVLDVFGDEASKGLTRIKPEMQAGDESNKYSKILKGLGLNPKDMDLWNPEQSALATMAMILSRKGDVEGVDKWYLRAQQHNKPGFGPKDKELLKKADKSYADNVIANTSRLYSPSTGYGLKETQEWMNKQKAARAKEAGEKVWSERFKPNVIPTESTGYIPNIPSMAQRAYGGGLHKAQDGYQLAQERLMKSFQPESSSLFTTSAPVEFPTYQNFPYNSSFDFPFPNSNRPGSGGMYFTEEELRRSPLNSGFQRPSSWEDIMSAWQQQERRQYPLDPDWGVYPKRTGPGPIRWPITPSRNTGIPWPNEPTFGPGPGGLNPNDKTVYQIPPEFWDTPGLIMNKYGGANSRRLPNRRETNKNIKSSINYLMRRNETLFGPRGRNFYNPNPMSKYYKGGIAFPQQPTAGSTKGQQESEFYAPNWIPPGPVGFYEHGGIAYPQLPTEDYFFSGSSWMPTYGMGGLPGGANEMSMPCMECGGYMQPGGPVTFAQPKTSAQYERMKTKLGYTDQELQGVGVSKPGLSEEFLRKQKEQKGQYTPATGGGYTKIGSNPNELYDYVVGQGYQPRPVQQMVNAIPPQKYGGNLNMAQDGRIIDWAKQQQQNLAERTGQGIPSGVSKYYGAFDVPNLSKMDSVVTSPINPNIGMAFKGSKSMLVPLDKSAEQDVRKINKPFTVATPSGRGEREVFVNYQEEGGFMSPDNMMDYPMFYTGGYPMMYADGGNIMDYDQDQMIKNLGNSFMSGIQQNIENDAFNKASQNLYENMMPMAQYGYSQNPQNMLNMGMAQQMLADMNNNPSNLISSLGALGDTAGTYTKYKIKKGKKYEIPAGDIAASSAPANQNMATARYGTAYIPKAQGGLNNAIPQGSLLNPQTLRNEMFKLPAKTQSSVEMSPELEAKKKAFYDAASAYDQRWNAYNQQARGQGQGYTNQGSYAPGYQSIYDMYGNQDYRVGRMSRSMKDLLPYITYNPQLSALKKITPATNWLGRRVGTTMEFTTVYDPRTGQQVQVPTASAQQQEDPNLARYNKDLAEGLAETSGEGGKNWFEKFKDKRAARKASKESNAPASKSPFVEGRPGRLFGPEENPMTPYGTIPTGTTSAQNMSYAPASQPNFLDSYPSINNFDYNAMMNNMNMSADYAPTNTGNFAPMGMRYEYGGDYEMGVPVELTEDQINQIMAAGGQITYID